MAEQLCLLTKCVRASVEVRGNDGWPNEGEPVRDGGPTRSKTRGLQCPGRLEGKTARNRLGKYGHEKHTNEQLKPSPKPHNPKLPGRQGAVQAVVSQMQVYC